MRITILTLFPEMFNGFISESIIKRALNDNIVEIKIIDMREYSTDKHHKVDDTPYGGGAGMVLKVDVVVRAIRENKNLDTKVILLTPQGKTYKQSIANELSKEKDIMLVCGHYEGFDERIRDYCDIQISVGDFVLTGGEIPAMLISDSVIRLLDGGITSESYHDDSFYNGLLEYPQYTRPSEFEGKVVPSVLQNGDHKKINEFRRYQSLKRTYLYRPDLLENYEFNKEDLKMLSEIKKEENR